MMKVFISIIFFTMVCYLLINQVSACSIDARPHFYIKTPSLENCYFISYNESLSSDTSIIEFIRNKTESRYVNCDNIILFEKDQEIFRNVISQFNKKYYVFASVNIEKQSDTEYLNFQKQVDKVNADKCDCERFDNVTRLNNWTVYVESEDCGHDTMCQSIPPEGCFGRLIYVLFWENPIFLLISVFAVPVAIIIGLIFIVKKVRKK